MRPEATKHSGKVNTSIHGSGRLTAPAPFSRYIAKAMNLDEVKSGLHDWGSNNKYIALIYLYGSKVTGSYSENSDIDVAVEIDESELEPHYSNAMSVWFSHKQSWANELIKIIGVEVHLEWLHQENTPTVKSGVETGHILVYDKAI